MRGEARGRVHPRQSGMFNGWSPKAQLLFLPRFTAALQSLPGRAGWLRIVQMGQRRGQGGSFLGIMRHKHSVGQKATRQHLGWQLTVEKTSADSSVHRLGTSADRKAGGLPRPRWPRTLKFKEGSASGGWGDRATRRDPSTRRQRRGRPPATVPASSTACAGKPT